MFTNYSRYIYCESSEGSRDLNVLVANAPDKLHGISLVFWVWHKWHLFRGWEAGFDFCGFFVCFCFVSSRFQDLVFLLCGLKM